MKYELKEHSFGNTIGQGFNLYFDNLIFLFLVSIIAHIPMYIWTYLSLPVEPGSSGLYRYLIINFLISLIIGSFISGIIIHVISKKYLNEKISSRDYLSRTLPLVLPILGLAILETLGIAVGVVLLIVPGMILALGWGVATQVLVVERKGIIDSLSRSWNLTKGSKGTIFGLYILIGIILVVFSLIIKKIISLIIVHPVINTLLEQVVNSLVNPIMPCIIIVLYFNLRIKKEGFNIEHLANQFQSGPVKEQQ
jgi:hypothetical protein